MEELSSIMTEAEARLFKYRDLDESGAPVKFKYAMNLTLLLRNFKQVHGLSDGEVAKRFQILDPVDGVATGKPLQAITHGVYESKLTKQKLKEMIKEELEAAMDEGWKDALAGGALGLAVAAGGGAPSVPSHEPSAPVSHVEKGVDYERIFSDLADRNRELLDRRPAGDRVPGLSYSHGPGKVYITATLKKGARPDKFDIGDNPLRISKQHTIDGGMYTGQTRIQYEVTK